MKFKVDTTIYLETETAPTIFLFFKIPAAVMKLARNLTFWTNQQKVRSHHAIAITHKQRKMNGKCIIKKEL